MSDGVRGADFGWELEIAWSGKGKGEVDENGPDGRGNEI